MVLHTIAPRVRAAGQTKLLLRRDLGPKWFIGCMTCSSGPGTGVADGPARAALHLLPAGTETDRWLPERIHGRPHIALEVADPAAVRSQLGATCTHRCGRVRTVGIPEYSGALTAPWASPSSAGDLPNRRASAIPGPAA